MTSEAFAEQEACFGEIQTLLDSGADDIARDCADLMASVIKLDRQVERDRIEWWTIWASRHPLDSTR